MDREQLAAPSSRAVRRGEIYWVAADELRGSQPGQPHPHVIVQDDLFNQSRIGTVVVCALSSNLGKAPEVGNVLLDDGEGGLQKRSIVIASQVSCLYKSRLGERIGCLSPQRVEQILSALAVVQRRMEARS